MNLILNVNVKKLIILLLIHGARRKRVSTSITVENVILDHDKVIYFITAQNIGAFSPKSSFFKSSYKGN